MAVPAGVRTGAPEADRRRLLPRFHPHRPRASAGFEGAARIYRRCRQAGIPGTVMLTHSVAAIDRSRRLPACPPTRIPNTYRQANPPNNGSAMLIWTLVILRVVGGILTGPIIWLRHTARRSAS